MSVMWAVETTDRFAAWFASLDDTDRANVLASLLVLRQIGPQLARPYSDTVKGSSHRNMKELRIQSKGKPLRERTGVVLCAGSKGGNDKRFYDEMIPIADREFTAHLERLRRGKRNG